MEEITNDDFQELLRTFNPVDRLSLLAFGSLPLIAVGSLALVAKAEWVAGGVGVYGAAAVGTLNSSSRFRVLGSRFVFRFGPNPNIERSTLNRTVNTN